MAESLVELSDPLLTALTPGPEAPPARVVAAMAAALLPAEAEVAPPPWLRPEQDRSFRRTLAAVERHGGALLADPVGSGKTWIALAVARAMGTHTVVCAPATLLSQWAATAARCDVAIALHSHERLSRGQLPAGTHRLVIVDECHWFREPDTRRYRTIAPWLVGRSVLLLSATPVVNRLTDLVHQLLLAVPDDTLLAAGCASLHAAFRAGAVPPALGTLVLCGNAPAGLPALRRRRIATPLSEGARVALQRLGALRLSRAPGIRALLAGALGSALASSPAALAAMLERYAILLRQARDAAAAGRSLSRDALRAAVGSDPDQLVLWELLSAGEGPVEVALEDSTPVAALLAEIRRAAEGPDARLEQLRTLLRDGRATVVFTGSRTTLQWLRRELAPLGPAWLTGSAAGIGPGRCTRAEVLACFRPGATPRSVASLLLTTDVAAEGLDLQRAVRVVHYDLPWTAVRTAQRTGRVRRLGASAREVEVVTFLPAPEVERTLGRLGRLAAKGRLPARAGLSEDGRWLFRWRGDLAPLAALVGTSDVAVVEGPEPGWLVCLGLSGASRPGSAHPARLFWIGDDGGISERAEEVVPRLLAAADAPAGILRPDDRLRIPSLLAPLARDALAALGMERWRAVPRPPDQRRLVTRLLALAPTLARRRDREGVQRVDGALATLAGGLRAGEVLLASRLLPLDDAGLIAGLLGFGPPRLLPPPALPRIAGIVRVTMFRRCRHSAPSCSTSTEP